MNMWMLRLYCLLIYIYIYIYIYISVTSGKTINFTNTKQEKLMSKKKKLDCVTIAYISPFIFLHNICMHINLMAYQPLWFI